MSLGLNFGPKGISFYQGKGTLFLITYDELKIAGNVVMQGN